MPARRCRDQPPPSRPPKVRPKPTADTVLFKDRLLYLLQPPLEHLFAGKQVEVPFQPYPYQLEGIAFLMPRHAALLADEMGLGKTMQAILALRLLFQAGLIRRALVVCPKPLVINWTRELRSWADGRAVRGDRRRHRRRGGRPGSCRNCPLKLVNYEMLTRDAEFVADDARALRRGRARRGPADQEPRVEDGPGGARRCTATRSWAMTGTPIENRTEDLVNIFAFVDPGPHPAGHAGQASCRS